jgi:exopolysaccharide biosynthesis protein
MPVRALLLPLWLLVLAVIAPAQQPALGKPERVADGVLLYRLHEYTLLDPPGPLAVQALRVDGQLAKLEIVRGGGEEIPTDTVETMATKRAGAVAAINGGFFSLQTGKPTDFLKVDGKVVNGSRRHRGAFAILERDGVTRLIFDRVAVTTARVPRYDTMLGTSAAEWSAAPYALAGAGLLMLNGRQFSDWTVERISARFDTTRHPRTMIGTDAQDAIWLITVDGRNPIASLGMNFAELQRLSRRLGLRSALNLDGGGSTTMWVDGKIVNHPSDRSGPRKVSDAIVVVPRTKH